MRALPLIIETLGLLAALAQASDWPQFRGPNRDGVWTETGVMQTFPTERLSIRWRAAAGGGLSSPIVSGGRVFLCESERKKPKAWERVQCYDAASGQRLWTHTDDVSYPEWAFDPAAATGPDATPIAAGGKVYTLGRMGNLVCLNFVDGSVLWQRDLTKNCGPADSFGSTPSPLIEENLLILVPGGKPAACVLAFDKDTGKEVWRALDDTWTYSSPIIITAGGKRQLIVWTPEAVTSLDPATGKTWWREKRATRGDFTAACPVFNENLLFVGGIMFQLNPEKPAASALWPETITSYTRRILSQTSIPLLRDGCVYSDKSHGRLVCLEALTGKLHWQKDGVTDKTNGAAQQFYPNGDSMLIWTNQGDLIRAQLSLTGYQELSRVHVIEPTYQFGGRKVVWPLPAFAHHHVFVRNDQELICASMEAQP